MASSVREAVERVTTEIADERLFPDDVFANDLRIILADLRRKTEALEECLREHGGFTIKGQCERNARAALDDSIDMEKSK